jgi:hypothetical protein
MILQDNDYCIVCKNMYTNKNYKWCKQCETNRLKKNFTNWTSGSEKIDNFIQEKQLKINNPWHIVFEWIPYDKFLDIKEVDKDDFSTVYSALWEDGPLYWDENNDEYKGYPKEVALKCSHNLQNADEFLSKV